VNPQFRLAMIGLSEMQSVIGFYERVEFPATGKHRKP